MESDADTPDEVFEAFVLPGRCPQCGLWETTLITEFQAQVIETAPAPPARTLRLTDDTTDAEMSAFIRGKPYP